MFHRDVVIWNLTYVGRSIRACWNCCQLILNEGWKLNSGCLLVCPLKASPHGLDFSYYGSVLRWSHPRGSISRNVVGSCKVFMSNLEVAELYFICISFSRFSLAILDSNKVLSPRWRKDIASICKPAQRSTGFPRFQNL